MVATTAARGLSRTDLDGIRTTLAAGRKPKVVFTEAAGQIAGQTGQVIELMDPPVDEWVVVRFGRDELPFSPTDLAIPSRAAAKPKAAPAPPAPPAEVPYEPVRNVPPPRQEATTMPATSTNSSTVEAAVAPADAKPVRKAAPRQPKVKPPATLTVTLAYTEGEWMVGAQQGSKALAKPYTIKASEALRMVALLDVPGVHEAVEQIVEAERADAQAHAERLRAELAEIEAHLADLPTTKR
jgi:hypothetical protein